MKIGGSNILRHHVGFRSKTLPINQSIRYPDPKNVELHSLNNLFARFDFLIPDYQRGYAWGETQVTEFWEDVGRIDIANPEHFTGTLILEAVPGKEGKTQATVVDGQQRLTTVVLLAAALCERLDRAGQNGEASEIRSRMLGSLNKPAFRYGPAHDAWPFLKLMLFKDASAVAKASTHRTAYTKNLEGALTLLRERVNELAEDAVGRLIVNVRTKLVFSVIEVDPRHFNIHVAFESINHRGKQLTKLELLKNRLIYVATVMRQPASDSAGAWGQKKDALRDDINSTWGDIYSWLGREGKEALDEEEFLRTHAIMYFDTDTGAKEWLEALLFRTVFTAAAAMKGTLEEAHVRDYLDSLRLSAVLWSHLRRPRDMPVDQMLWLSRINHVRRPLFDSLLLASYVRLVGGDISLAVDLRKTSSIDSVLIDVLREVERFNVLVFLVTGKRSHTARKDFATVAYWVHSARESYAGDVQTALAYLARYIRSCVHNVDPNNTEGFADSEFGWPGYLDLDAFQNDISKTLRHGMGFYGHEWTKVVLFEYEEHLRSKDKGAVKVAWDRVSADSIEHIYPQDDTHWQPLTKSLGGGRKKARVNSFRHSLGNLVLLNRTKNSSLQNLPYTGKGDQRAKRPRFEQGSYSETAIAANYRSWTKGAIEKRGKELLQFAERRWDFSFQAAGIKYDTLLTIK